MAARTRRRPAGSDTAEPVEAVTPELTESAPPDEPSAVEDAPVAVPDDLPVDRAINARELPVALIDPSPDNPRESIGDLTELTDSIRSQGILQPLTVVPSPTTPGRYLIVFGHRRFFGAMEAALDVVPAVIRDDMTGTVLHEARLVENVQRADLTPLEEAHAIARLIKAGYTARAVSEALGKNEGWVSKRRSLLKLSAEGQAAVADGKLPIAAAVDVSKLPKDAQGQAITGITQQKMDPVVAVRRAQESVIQARERKDVEAELKRMGVNYVLLPDSASWDYCSKKGWREESMLSLPPTSGNGRLADLAAHRGAPCAVALIRQVPSWNEKDPLAKYVSWACSDPAPHAEAYEAWRATQDAPAIAAQAEEAAAEQAAVQAAIAVTDARQAFIASLFAGRLPQAEATEYLLRGIVLDGVLVPDRSLGDRGIDPTALAARWLNLDGERAWNTIAAAADDATGNDRLRWALAVRFATDEAFMELHADGELSYAPDYRAVAVLLGEHLRFLTAAGYTLSELEEGWLREFGDLSAFMVAVYGADPRVPQPEAEEESEAPEVVAVSVEDLDGAEAPDGEAPVGVDPTVEFVAPAGSPEDDPMLSVAG